MILNKKQLNKILLKIPPNLQIQDQRNWLVIKRDNEIEVTIKVKNSTIKEREVKIKIDES